MNNVAEIEYLKDIINFDNVLCINLLKICHSASSIDSKAFLDKDDLKLDVSTLKQSIVSKGYDSTYINGYIDSKYRNQSCYLVFDEVMTDHYESWFENKRYFIMQDQVYFQYAIDEIEPNAYKELFTFSAQPWHLVGVVLKVKDTAQMADIIKDVQLLKESLQEIIIGAFDGEGYVHYYINQ